MPVFSLREKLQVAVLLFCLAPFVLTIFLGVESGNQALVAGSTGLAIASSAFALAWGTESLQFLVSQTLALAVLALVQVLPEYSVEAVLAYQGGTYVGPPALDPLQFATAAMTGANRLLIGLGWPLVFAMGAIVSRKQGKNGSDLVLDSTQGVEILFLGAATIYSFVIVLRRSLGIVDAVVLLAIFGAYLYVAKKLPPHGEERLAELQGPARAVASLKGARKLLAIVFLVGIGCLVIVLGAAPFVNSFLALGRSAGISEYLLIQWFTPVLTELPETITAFYWAARSGRAPLALANLVSSKLNQWTVLVSTIPMVYSVALGAFGTLGLTTVQTNEIFLTASQSLYGFVCLMDLRLTKVDAAFLLGLFTVQFVFPGVRLEVAAAYLALSAFELARTRGSLELFSSLSSIYRQHIR